MHGVSFRIMLELSRSAPMTLGSVTWDPPWVFSGQYFGFIIHCRLCFFFIVHMVFSFLLLLVLFNNLLRGEKCRNLMMWSIGLAESTGLLIVGEVSTEIFWHSYLLGCVIWGLIKRINQFGLLNWWLGLGCWFFNLWTFLQCLGLEDGWLTVVMTYWFWYYHHMFSRFWKLRGFLDFRNLWCLKVEASMWMEKVRVNAVIC